MRDMIAAIILLAFAGFVWAGIINGLVELLYRRMR
jgi:hypothetical protein